MMSKLGNNDIDMSSADDIVGPADPSDHFLAQRRMEVRNWTYKILRKIPKKFEYQFGKRTRTKKGAEVDIDQIIEKYELSEDRINVVRHYFGKMEEVQTLEQLRIEILENRIMVYARCLLEEQIGNQTDPFITRVEKAYIEYAEKVCSLHEERMGMIKIGNKEEEIDIVHPDLTRANEKRNKEIAIDKEKVDENEQSSNTIVANVPLLIRMEVAKQLLEMAIKSNKAVPIHIQNLATLKKIKEDIFNKVFPPDSE